MRTVIVEDELLSRLYLSSLLDNFCPEVEVVAKAESEQAAIEAITRLQPDLVLLDIELRSGSGFEVLRKLEHTGACIIFITALDHYAINAIRICGMDYLQKPVENESLQAAVRSAAQNRDNDRSRASLACLLEALENGGVPRRLLLPDEKGESVLINEIVRIESADKGSIFLLENGSSRADASSLSHWEQLLRDLHFFRIHPLHLVNIAKVAGVESDKLQLNMCDGSIVPASPKRIAELARRMKEIR